MVQSMEFSGDIKSACKRVKIVRVWGWLWGWGLDIKIRLLEA